MRSFEKFLKEDGPSIGFGSMISTGGASDTMALAGRPPSLPDTDIVLPPDGTFLPHVRKKGKVEIFDYNKNPIYVQLDDGTKLFFTKKEYDRIKGPLPLVPKLTELEVTFMRLPVDNSPVASKILFCKSRFLGNQTEKTIHNIYTNNLMANQL